MSGREKTRIILNLVQIILLPISIVITESLIAKWCFAVATMLVTFRIYMEALEEPKTEEKK